MRDLSIWGFGYPQGVLDLNSCKILRDWLSFGGVTCYMWIFNCVGRGWGGRGKGGYLWPLRCLRINCILGGHSLLKPPGCLLWSFAVMISPPYCGGQWRGMCRGAVAGMYWPLSRLMLCCGLRERIVGMQKPVGPGFWFHGKTVIRTSVKCCKHLWFNLVNFCQCCSKENKYFPHFSYLVQHTFYYYELNSGIFVEWGNFY